jgi:molybdopterin synthase sulfur carrier subunit
MRISVRFFTVLREITGKKEEALEIPDEEKGTIATVLKSLASRYGEPFFDYVFEPKTGAVKGFLQFFINGQSSDAMQGLETKLEEGDVLAIVPPVGGG